MEAVIFISAQASGKSTFFSRQFANSHVRINLDMLKTRHRERLLFNTCLEMKQSFVVDNTNPELHDRQRYIRPAREAGFQVVGYYFASKIQDLLDRNSQRSGAQRIPEVGLRDTHRRLVLPSHAEGFDSLFYVEIGDNNDFKVAEWSDEV